MLDIRSSLLERLGYPGNQFIARDSSATYYSGANEQFAARKPLLFRFAPCCYFILFIQIVVQWGASSPATFGNFGLHAQGNRSLSRGFCVRQSMLKGIFILVVPQFRIPILQFFICPWP